MTTQICNNCQLPTSKPVIVAQVHSASAGGHTVYACPTCEPSRPQQTDPFAGLAALRHVPAPGTGVTPVQPGDGALPDPARLSWRQRLGWDCALCGTDLTVRDESRPLGAVTVHDTTHGDHETFDLFACPTPCGKTVTTSHT